MALYPYLAGPFGPAASVREGGVGAHVGTIKVGIVAIPEVHSTHVPP